MARSNSFKHYTTLSLLLSSMPLHASFIEQTLGTAVVNDATATYFNPAALTILSQKQLITLGTVARSQLQFSGSAQRKPFGLVESGTSTNLSNFFLPSMYLGIPINDKFAGGFAVVINDFNRELDNHSVLRYIQAPNHTYDIDLVPALGIKVNKFLSIGGHLNFSHAHFLQEPRSGIPSLNIPESRSKNDSRGNSTGWDAGILIKPNKRTAMGFNHRSAISYHLKGSSTLNSPLMISSNNYHFKYWTPARSVFSLSHFINKQFGMIGTIQYLQWDIFKKSNIYNFATQAGSKAIIVPQATIHYHFHNSWLLTLGTIHKISPKWIARIAGTYNQSPADGQFQIGSGDSFAIGSSVGYKVMKNLSIDCSYAHAFFKNKMINIDTAQNNINGINKGDLDAVSLKLTMTV